MQMPTNDNPLTKREMSPAQRETTGEGGLAASIEAASKHKVPPPSGKGVAMAVLAVLVMAAVVYEIATHDGKPSTAAESSDKANGDPDGETAPTAKPKDPPATPVATALQFELPGDLSYEVAHALTEQLSKAAMADPGVHGPALAGLSKQLDGVPEALRPETRKSLLTALATIAKGPGAAAALRAAKPLVAQLSAERLADARRMTLIAELALDDPKTTEPALVYLRGLPESARPIGALEAVALDPNREVKLRLFAVLAIPVAARSDALKALSKDERAPQTLRAALQD